MDQHVHPAGGGDYRQYSQVWQRVSPGMEPYPGMGQTGQYGAGGQLMPAAPISPPPPVPAPPQPPAGTLPPGAIPDPCCMGSEAAEMLGVLRGFIQEELADQRTFLQLSRWAPVWARQELKAMAEDAGNHAKRLCAACYLITGHGDYPTALIYGETLPRQWQAALRERYHSEACNGLNYARAAEDTTDPCLSRLLRAMSMDEYRHADQLMTMLQRSL